MAHKANTRVRQPPLFRTMCSTWAQDTPFFFISRSNDLLHVFFGLPRLRLPAFGVHLNAIFGIASDGILIKCPIQVHLLRLISVIMDEVSCSAIITIFIKRSYLLEFKGVWYPSKWKGHFGGGGVSLTSCFSTDKTLGTGYDIHLLCAMIADHVILPAISFLHFWAAGRS